LLERSPSNFGLKSSEPPSFDLFLSKNKSIFSALVRKLFFAKIYLSEASNYGLIIITDP